MTEGERNGGGEGGGERRGTRENLETEGGGLYGGGR